MSSPSSFALPPAAWPRTQLLEWHEQRWLPAVLRRAMTSYLAAVIDVANPFEPLAARLAELCRRSGSDRIVDLCAGAGGPWPRLHRAVAAALGRPLVVTLTDLLPDRVAFARLAAASDGAVRGEDTPVDARAVPDALGGVRTMFDCFHHFAPADARAILADAARRRQPLVIVEGTRRRLGALGGMLLVPLFVLLVTPRIRPLSFAQLLFTYLVPLVPLLVLWDGVVSCLRSYRAREIAALVAGLDHGYTWDIGTYRRRGAIVRYVIGAPRTDS